MKCPLKQELKHPDSEFTMPFGLSQMDNGEIAILVSREKAIPAGGRIVEPNIAFSKDGGATWSDFQAIPRTKGRPQFLQRRSLPETQFQGFGHQQSLGGRLSFGSRLFQFPQSLRVPDLNADLFKNIEGF